MALNKKIIFTAILSLGIFILIFLMFQNFRSGAYINISPNDASIKINGISQKNHGFIPLAKGNYLLEVEKNGFKPISKNIQVETFKKSRYTFNLVEITPLLQNLPIYDYATRFIIEGKYDEELNPVYTIGLSGNYKQEALDFLAMSGINISKTKINFINDHEDEEGDENYDLIIPPLQD